MDYITDQEVWKDIKGYEGYYQVSNYGRVKSLFRIIPGRWGAMTVQERIIKESPNSWGYSQVGLNKLGKTRPARVHRLVAEAFLENPDNLPEVNHIDENKANNHVNNLEWCSTSDNHLHGTMPKQRRANALKNNGLTEANEHRKRSVKSICVNTGKEKVYEYMGLARKEGFNVGCISNVCSGRVKTHKGYYWEYIN